MRPNFQLNGSQRWLSRVSNAARRSVLDLGEDRLDAFATLFVYRLADVDDVQAGIEVVPTYRSPPVTH